MKTQLAPPPKDHWDQQLVLSILGTLFFPDSLHNPQESMKLFLSEHALEEMDLIGSKKGNPIFLDSSTGILQCTRFCSRLDPRVIDYPPSR